MPRGSRIGYIAQDAPAGSATPFETVLAADIERAALLDEAEHSHDPDRLGELHERLNAIDAHAAPARAARILVGLGFDEAAQHRPLDSFSGGWRMRVALAALAVLGSRTCCCSTSRRTISTSRRCCGSRTSSNPIRATILLVSHERDFLNNVVDHILHLDRGKLTLYPGGYDAFERQRAERQAQLASARAQQEARARQAAGLYRPQQRPRLDRQAGAVAGQGAGADAADRRAARRSEPELRLSRARRRCGRRWSRSTSPRSAMTAMPVLKRLNLRLDPDDRIALLGRNGNGKTTLARLLAAQLRADGGRR